MSAPPLIDVMQRHHHLDALRALAMLLGIAFHAAFGFITPSGTTSTALQWLVTTAHTFRMPLFFLMAGLFGALLLARGTDRFVRNRATRIALPFGVAVLVLVPLGEIAHQWRSHEAIDVGYNGPQHFWFLEYLLIFYAVALAARRSATLRTLLEALGASLRRLLFSGPLPALNIAAVSTVILLVGGGWGYKPATTFLPDVGTLTYYGACFALGWALWGKFDLLRKLGHRPLLQGTAALVLSLALYRVTRSTDLDGAGLLDVAKLSAVALSALVGWLIVAALYGASLRVFDRPRPAVRFVVDASYWMYLGHVALIAALHRPIAALGLPPAAGFVTMVTLVSVVLLALYVLVVRHTVIGRVLHGPRPRTTRPWAASSPAPKMPAAPVL